MIKKILFLFLAICLLFTACHEQDDERMLKTLQEIQDYRLKNPQLALEQLNSLEDEIYASSEYVRMKSEMLKLRLQNLACIHLTETKTVKRVIKYFSKHGTSLEQQEVYYIAGSVYRDIQDAPTAIDHFLKSESIALRDEKECDLEILFSTYSNLSYLYGCISEHSEELKYALKRFPPLSGSATCESRSSISA